MARAYKSSCFALLAGTWRVFRFKARHLETKTTNGSPRLHNTRHTVACITTAYVLVGPDVNHFALLPPRAAIFGLLALSPHGESAAAYYTSKTFVRITHRFELDLNVL